MNTPVQNKNIVHMRGVFQYHEQGDMISWLINRARMRTAAAACDKEPAVATLREAFCAKMFVETRCLSLSEYKTSFQYPGSHVAMYYEIRCACTDYML